MARFPAPSRLYQKAQRARSKAISLPSPVGGWNAIDSIAAMPPKDAVLMVNWFPLTTSVTLRSGYENWATGISGQVESLLAYSGASVNALFGINKNGSVYDVTVQGPITTNYGSLPGSAANYFSTPSAAANQITGDIDIICYAAATDWTPAAGGEIVSKRSAGQFSYQFLLSAAGPGFLNFTTTPDGSTNSAAVSTIAPTVADGAGIWVRATKSVNNGSGGNTTTFYTSTQPVTTALASLVWVPLGAPVINVGTTSIFNGTADLEIGAQSGGTATLFNGKIYSAYVYAGIGGTLKASFVANDAAQGAASWVSLLTAETWTTNTSGSPAAAIAGSQVLTGLSNGRWQYVNVSTPGGHFIEMCNGVDGVYTYNGTVWTSVGASITGVTAANLMNINIFKNRVWFIEKGTLKAWYLPVQSITGAANALDLSAFCPHGGTLIAMATWTIDSGYGVDDYAVFISSNGDVIVYRGTDPTSASTWAMVGQYWIGSPIGPRCYVKTAGDVLLLTTDGLYPLSAALQSSRLNPKAAISYKIQQAVSQAITEASSNFGWQILPFPDENMLLVNIPLTEGNGQHQYAMNTITKSWADFSGWNANCWELFQSRPYFGANGSVGRAWSTTADAGSQINANCLQAFNYFGAPGQLKRYTQIRPTFQTDGSPALYANVNIDFDESDTTAPLAFAPVSFATWDSGTWDSSTWVGISVLKNWQGANGVGYAAAPRVKIAASNLSVEWISTDITMEVGAIL